MFKVRLYRKVDGIQPGVIEVDQDQLDRIIELKAGRVICELPSPVTVPDNIEVDIDVDE